MFADYRALPEGAGVLIAELLGDYIAGLGTTLPLTVPSKNQIIFPLEETVPPLLTADQRRIFKWQRPEFGVTCGCPHWDVWFLELKTLPTRPMSELFWLTVLHIQMYSANGGCQ